MDMSSVRDQVEAAYGAWDQAFNRADAQAVAALYARDAMLLPATHAVIEGPAGVAEFFGSLLANGVTGHRLELIAVHGDGSMIVGAARWSAGGKNADGSAATFGGLATHLFERQPDGSLRLKLHTFN